MIKLNEEFPGVLHVELSGKLHDEDYQRLVPAVDAAPLVAAWHDRVQVIVATSNDVLDNLLGVLGAAGAAKAMATPLVVVSKRMADHARERGFTTVLVAAGAGDEAVVAALPEACALTVRRPHLLG